MSVQIWLAEIIHRFYHFQTMNFLLCRKTKIKWNQIKKRISNKIIKQKTNFWSSHYFYTTLKPQHFVLYTKTKRIYLIVMNHCPTKPKFQFCANENKKEFEVTKRLWINEVAYRFDNNLRKSGNDQQEIKFLV